jgi:type II restriction/modification system DNA methylase subunit YeeA
MNKAKLKTYAPQARKDFIAAVTARSHRLGLSDSNGQLQIAPAEKNGDLVIIAGQSWPAKISRQRDKLIALIQKNGFAQTMENVAYTWFNRFAALRYMEIHDYLTHGYRVLSNRAGGLPEILGSAPELAQHGDLPGLKPERAIELKLAGDQDGELYRLTLIAQCNALSNVMPFLFERIDDETELLLPDNLLLTDSVIAKLVDAIPEEDWSQVEIIGWLYQFYISEKKDQVIGKVVKSEDIPAATQLFTPNWIVQYLVQNSIGRLWLMANPASTLKSQWPYYIEPAEQSPEVQAQLDALIQTRMAEDGGGLNPETLTVLDPACGSGHILVEAYEVLKAIYLERGYQPRSIPRLILEKNLFGLDIDDRAAQLAGFALLMKARADDRRLLDNPPKLNVLALLESKGLDADELTNALSGYVALTRPTIDSLLDTFAHAKTFGSLIQISGKLNAELAEIGESLQQASQKGDLVAQAAAFDLLPFVRQAINLGMQFDAVVANPPYMGSKGMNTILKRYGSITFPEAKYDLFSMFIMRGFAFLKANGMNSMVTMQAWMFLSSYEEMREQILAKSTLYTLAHLGPKAFTEISGEVVQTTAFVSARYRLPNYKPTFFRLVDLTEPQKYEALKSKSSRIDIVSQDEFTAIPGAPIAYWTSYAVRRVFSKCKSIVEVAAPKQGISTCNNDLFLRYWSEVSLAKIGFSIDSRVAAAESEFKWFPYNKGGAFRKWYGNNEYVVNWENDGLAVHQYNNLPIDYNGAPMRGKNWLFKEGMTWSSLAGGSLSGRYSGKGFVFDAKEPMLFPNEPDKILYFVAIFNSKPVETFLKILAPTLDFNQGPIGKVPFPALSDISKISENARDAIRISKNDWDSYETSWDFLGFPLAKQPYKKLSEAFEIWVQSLNASKAALKTLEDENNSLFIEAYGLQDELSPEVPENQITLSCADREKDCQRLISYGIGCMMGRYSLDEPGLIYAHAGNIGFNPSRYSTFPADADGIVPITDELWFEDDAANRIREFLLAVWGAETLEENLVWLAESLGQKANETPQETILRYLAGSFFKDHLQTYKKRPIYWLFSSGKQGAFQALVYLHRYHEGTLARMRAEYVVPLTGKIQSRIEMLEKDAAAASSNAARSKLNKDIEKLKKKHVELLAYDEKLRHYADLRIQLDLDDGVKVNYGKFGDLLADVKAVTGGNDE